MYFAGASLLTKIQIAAWISNYIHSTLWDVNTRPCPKFNGGLVKPPLKLGHRGVMAYNNFMLKTILIQG